MFNLRKLKSGKVKEQHQVKILNRFATMGNLNDNMHINRAWEVLWRILTV